jgi:hypothetical protein
MRDVRESDQSMLFEPETLNFVVYQIEDSDDDRVGLPESLENERVAAPVQAISTPDQTPELKPVQQTPAPPTENHIQVQPTLPTTSRDNGKHSKIEMPPQRNNPANGIAVISLYERGKRDFSGTDLQGADLQGADLPKARMILTNLREAQMSHANLDGASMTKANLREANLWGASLVRAKLRGVDLHGADLRNADLGNADLREADLRGANLLGANLLGARLDGARLDAATQIDANWRLIWEIVSNGKDSHQSDQA